MASKISVILKFGFGACTHLANLVHKRGLKISIIIEGLRRSSAVLTIVVSNNP